MEELLGKSNSEPPPPKKAKNPEKTLIVLKKNINMGMGTENPVEKVSFYDKANQPVVMTQERLKKGLPEEMSSDTFLLVSRDPDQGRVTRAKQLTKKFKKELVD